MAITVMTNAQVFVNGVDLSDHASKVTVEDTRDTVDVTAFGATSKAIQKGLGDAKITVDFFQDFAAGKVHATLSPLIASTTPFAVEVRPVNGARSTTNPASLLTGALLMTTTCWTGQLACHLDQRQFASTQPDRRGLPDRVMAIWVVVLVIVVIAALMIIFGRR
jgi:hypothetical protein